MPWYRKLLLDVIEWTDGALWRSWLAHALIAVPICALAGPAVAVVFYLLRELEQIAHQVAWSGHLNEYAYDYLYDVLAPAATAALWAALGLPVLGR